MLRSPLLHFVLLGLLLFALRGAWKFSPDFPQIEIARDEIEESITTFELSLGRSASDEEERMIEEQIIDQRLWIESAKAFGLHRTDPIVRQRLVQNMRFLEEDSEVSEVNEAELLRRALDLDMDMSDSVVRLRLVDRAQSRIREKARAEIPSEEELRRHFRNHPDFWQEPTRLDLTHVYFSRDQRGASASREATEALRVLRDQSIEPMHAPAHGDPFLSGAHLHRAAPAQIVARLGPSFASTVKEAESQTWFGPVESAFGSHLVWIQNRAESHIPHYEVVQDRVRDNWVESEGRAAIARESQRLRRLTTVQIIED